MCTTCCGQSPTFCSQHPSGATRCKTGAGFVHKKKPPKLCRFPSGRPGGEEDGEEDGEERRACCSTQDKRRHSNAHIMSASNLVYKMFKCEMTQDDDLVLMSNCSGATVCRSGLFILNIDQIPFPGLSLTDSTTTSRRQLYPFICRLFSPGRVLNVLSQSLRQKRSL